MTGKRRRRQKWITFRGTKKAAEPKLTDLLRSINHNEFVEPSKVTLGEWLTKWFEIAKGSLRESTIVRSHQRRRGAAGGDHRRLAAAESHRGGHRGALCGRHSVRFHAGAPPWGLESCIPQGEA